MLHGAVRDGFLPDNKSLDAENTSLGSMTTNADFETAEAPVGTPTREQRPQRGLAGCGRSAHERGF